MTPTKLVIPPSYNRELLLFSLLFFHDSSKLRFAAERVCGHEKSISLKYSGQQNVCQIMGAWPDLFLYYTLMALSTIAIC
jgi:hypothetical protein